MRLSDDATMWAIDLHSKIRLYDLHARHIRQSGSNEMCRRSVTYWVFIWKAVATPSYRPRVTATAWDYGGAGACGVATYRVAWTLAVGWLTRKPIIFTQY